MPSLGIQSVESCHDQGETGASKRLTGSVCENAHSIFIGPKFIFALHGDNCLPEMTNFQRDSFAEGLPRT